MSEKMDDKYYLVHLLDDFSGSPKVLSSLIAYLIGENKTIDVLIGGKSEGFISDGTDDCTRYFYCRSENKYITLIYYLLSQLHLFFILCYKFYRDREITNKKIIVNTLLPFSAAIAAKLMRVKVYYYLHETSINPPILKTFLLKVVVLTSYKALFVSEFVFNDLCLKIDNKIVIYNPLPNDYEVIRLNEEQLINKWQNKNVLMACSLKDYKGIPEFVDLANLLQNFNFTLIINDNNKNIEKYFSKFIIPKNLLIFSRPTSLLDYYKSAFVVLNLSDQNSCIETFGLTLIEAMSSYTPVICPVVGGPVEVVHDYKNGYHIDSKNTDELVSKISLLSNDYNLWNTFAQSAKERSKYFSMNEYCKQLSLVLS
jgi:glycosyltransferase involved in cell wall biosynthesis